MVSILVSPETGNVQSKSLTFDCRFKFLPKVIGMVVEDRHVSELVWS